MYLNIYNIFYITLNNIQNFLKNMLFTVNYFKNIIFFQFNKKILFINIIKIRKLAQNYKN